MKHTKILICKKDVPAEFLKQKCKNWFTKVLKLFLEKFLPLRIEKNKLKQLLKMFLNNYHQTKKLHVYYNTEQFLYPEFQVWRIQWPQKLILCCQLIQLKL